MNNIIHYLLSFMMLGVCLSSLVSSPAAQETKTGLALELTDILFQYRQLPIVSQSPYLSPTDMVSSSDASVLYVACRTGRSVLVVNRRNPLPPHVAIQLPNEPTGLALSSDGKTLYVTCWSNDIPFGVVCVINTESRTLSRTLQAGHSPQSPVLDEQSNRLFVCNRFADIVSILDIASGVITDTVPCVREPFAAALTPDSSLLLVGNYLPLGTSEDDTLSSVVSLINTSTLQREADLSLVDGGHSISDICISPDGKYAYVPHIRANRGERNEVNPLLGGWINANAFSVVDIHAKAVLGPVLLDDVIRGAANPWACAIGPGDSLLLITSAGSQELHSINLAQLHKALDNVTSGNELTYDLSFSNGFTTRKYLSVRGPRSVCVVNDSIVVGGYFSDSLEILMLRNNALRSTGTIPLSDNPADPNQLRLGEFYFNDASTMCLKSWHSCHTCHPDGRSDAQNWDLLDDGSGNEKNTKSLVYSAVTPPSLTSGIRASMEIASRLAIEKILFKDPGSLISEKEAIDAYISSLRHVPSPRLIKGRLSETAVQGEQLFRASGCITCHPSTSYYTNMQRSAIIESGDAGPFHGKWDTPSLHELWRNAPHLHDGSFDELESLFIKLNDHKLYEDLSDEQMKQLAEFLNSL